MIPTKQQYIQDPEKGVYGDCQRAVIASLLELPITEVPHFLAEARGDPTHYWESMQAFLKRKGYAWLVIPKKSEAAFYGADHDIYHEISGPSPRGNGVTHAVVGCNGEIVFDPHPSDEGLAGDPAEWEHGYLVRTCEKHPAADFHKMSARQANKVAGIFGKALTEVYCKTDTSIPSLAIIERALKESAELTASGVPV